MTKHKICEGCKFNNYPTCSGTIMDGGNEMNIENLKEGFSCGQKDSLEITDFSIKIKSDLGLKIEDLETKNQEIIDRLNELEAKKL